MSKENAATITPTVGRNVYYHSHLGGIFAAIVTRVHTDTCIDLTVFPPGEAPVPLTSIEQGEAANQWDWMPFQKQQAAKAADEDRAMPELAHAGHQVVK